MSGETEKKDVYQKLAKAVVDGKGCSLSFRDVSRLLIENESVKKKSQPELVENEEAE